MADRHEEKYLIDYRQYSLLKARAMKVLTPDTNGTLGSYTVTSLYFDDPLYTALLEKQDGLPRHTKFRLRAYNGREDFIRLERKVKQGIITQKMSAAIPREHLSFLGFPNWDAAQFTGTAKELATQMVAGGLRPAITVRYERDAFFFPGTDLRLTFDRNLTALPPEESALFCRDRVGAPVLDGNTVIMEIKYGSYVPAFIRTLTGVPCQQLSVSKYALCQEK